MRPRAGTGSRGHARLGFAILLTSACAKGSTDESLPSSARVAAAESATPSATPSATATSATGPSGWKGGYQSVPGTIALPKDVKWKVPETAVGVGEGTIDLTIDRATGRVEGKVDGVLGPATIDGLASEGKLTATVSRQDPTDHGFTGTLCGDVGRTSAQGTLNVALADVSAVRAATFALSPVR